MFPLRLVNRYSNLGVEVIYPKVLDSGSRSNGPKLLIPMDSNFTLKVLVCSPEKITDIHNGLLGR